MSRIGSNTNEEPHSPASAAGGGCVDWRDDGADGGPEPGTVVLAWDGEEMYFAEFVVLDDNQFWASTCGAYPLRVTHWMPLPEPPRVAE